MYLKQCAIPKYRNLFNLKLKGEEIGRMGIQVVASN